MGLHRRFKEKCKRFLKVRIERTLSLSHNRIYLTTKSNYKLNHTISYQQQDMNKKNWTSILYLKWITLEIIYEHIQSLRVTPFGDYLSIICSSPTLVFQVMQIQFMPVTLALIIELVEHYILYMGVLFLIKILLPCLSIVIF